MNIFISSTRGVYVDVIIRCLISYIAVSLILNVMLIVTRILTCDKSKLGKYTAFALFYSQILCITGLASLYINCPIHYKLYVNNKLIKTTTDENTKNKWIKIKGKFENENQENILKTLEEIEKEIND